AILPFLPNGHYGPLGAWNPQRMWLVVVLVTGFSFLGYVANRIFCERHGTIATALIGGGSSSTGGPQSVLPRLCRHPHLRRAARAHRDRADRRRLQLDGRHPVARTAARARRKGWCGAG